MPCFLRKIIPVILLLILTVAAGCTQTRTVSRTGTASMPESTAAETDPREDYTKEKSLIEGDPADPRPETRPADAIIEELVVGYGRHADSEEGNTEALLKELEMSDPEAAARWNRIMALWENDGTHPEIHYEVLPDGLDRTDALCLVVLGYQLNPDGTMKEELTERLKVALRSARKYPEAYVLCTGGGTASSDKTATEAGRMAEWLRNQGIRPERIIVEDKSLTTAQNAVFSCRMLKEHYPQVTQIAILSSDYHIETGILLFGAEAILRSADKESSSLQIVSNAAYKAPSGSLSSFFQAGALIELSGDTETAFRIYYDTYDLHELPDRP